MPFRDADPRLDPFPGGLAPASAEPLSDAEITRALEAIGSDELTVLGRLVWGPPIGSVSDARRDVTLRDASSPIDRLLALGLLRPVNNDIVILPREVALVLRGDRFFGSGSRQDADSGSGSPGAVGIQPGTAGNDWRPVLAEASRDDLWVRLAFAEEDGTLTRAVVRVLYVAHGSAYLVRRAGARLNIPTHRIVAAEKLAPVVINDPPLEGEH
ncbi:hypothetical protein [Propionimicrobium sp. PCR01-08-3]|uniref:hypothetical protein n=1 Tax=Propionimicrobium sp. PCR01-08-3 TaxID=3052086 RepID=UPI00255CB7CE|nr:hypothetical protein [Propionimicrobium sp. PCR01-08-3]WIY82869.1 hypothetical protein QQ658_00460 [Propionimicrobium sp. PCR01-08-3]